MALGAVLKEGMALGAVLKEGMIIIDIFDLLFPPPPPPQSEALEVASFIRKTAKKQTTRFAGCLELGSLKLNCKVYTKVSLGGGGGVVA